MDEKIKKTFKIEDDRLIEISSQDVSNILESAKITRELQSGSRPNRGKMKDYHKLASIPEIIILDLINKGKIKTNYLGDKEQLAKLYEIIKKDYPAFLTTERKEVLNGD